MIQKAGSLSCDQLSACCPVMLKSEMSRLTSWLQTNPACSGRLLAIEGARTCSWTDCERIVPRGHQSSKHTLRRGMQASSADKVSVFFPGHDTGNKLPRHHLLAHRSLWCLLAPCHQARFAVGGFELGLVISFGCFLNRRRTYMYFKCLLQTYLLRKQIVLFFLI